MIWLVDDVVRNLKALYYLQKDESIRCKETVSQTYCSSLAGD